MELNRDTLFSDLFFPSLIFFAYPRVFEGHLLETSALWTWIGFWLLAVLASVFIPKDDANCLEWVIFMIPMALVDGMTERHSPIPLILLIIIFVLAGVECEKRDKDSTTDE